MCEETLKAREAVLFLKICICVKRPYEETGTLKGERDPTNPVYV